MTVETTVNIDPGVLMKLNRAADETGMNRSEIVVMVMRKALKDFSRCAPHDRAVRYQGKSAAITRRRLHLALFRRDYEYFLDMRKFFKRSVSLMVVFSVNEYLDNVIKMVLDDNYNSEADNYPYQNYLIVPEMVDDVICWKIYWGKPENNQKLFNQRE